MRVRPPATLRDTLNLFLFLDAETGLNSLLDRVAWAGANPRQTCHAILGALPPSPEVSVPAEPYRPRAHAAALLRAPEFQANIIRAVLSAFPEKRRLLFVHIPGCAGSDLPEKLGARIPMLQETLGNPAWVPPERFLATLARIIRRLQYSDEILVTGHIPLRWYLRGEGHGGIPWMDSPPPYRYGDRLFTVVRDPERLAISQASHVATRLLADPEKSRPDTKEWARLLGPETVRPEMSDEEVRALALKVLHHPEITRANLLCRSLGEDGTAESALSLLARCDIEITDTSRYDAWLHREWGVAAETRANVSQHILSHETLDPADRAHLRAITEEDRRLHERILERLSRSDAPSVRGPDLWR